MTKHLLPKLFLALAAASIGVAHAAAPVKTANGMLVDSQGMTLYTFDKDTGGKSTCNGPCAGMWPPVVAAPGATPEGDMTLITRDDGAKQWAWKGKPVYLYKPDTKPGEAKGDNFKDVWHVIKP